MGLYLVRHKIKKLVSGMSLFLSVVGFSVTNEVRSFFCRLLVILPFLGAQFVRQPFQQRRVVQRDFLI